MMIGMRDGLGDGRTGTRHRFAFRLQFATNDADIVWSFDADGDAVASHSADDDRDIATDNQPFADLARKNQHCHVLRGGFRFNAKRSLSFETQLPPPGCLSHGQGNFVLIESCKARARQPNLRKSCSAPREKLKSDQLADAHISYLSQAPKRVDKFCHPSARIETQNETPFSKWETGAGHVGRKSTTLIAGQSTIR